MISPIAVEAVNTIWRRTLEEGGARPTLSQFRSGLGAKEEDLLQGALPTSRTIRKFFS